MEINYGEVLLTKQEAKHGGSKIIYLPGQYKGLAEKNGYAVNCRIAHLQQPQVEQRNLSFYDQILGGAAHG